MNWGAKVRFHVSADHFQMGDVVEIRMGVEYPDGRFGYAETMTVRVMEEKERGLRIPPFMEIPAQAAQALCDGLWAAGIRPTNGAGSVGQLGAVQAHLADMRNIVAVKLGVPLSGKAVAP